MRFSADNQPKGRGRPKGSKDKKMTLPDSLKATALEQLTEAVSVGESWAITLVMSRTHPALKPITPEDSLDGEMLAAKIKEVTEFEERLKALEDQSNEN
jgi:hypothetical protein